jgi:hypothetical protein
MKYCSKCKTEKIELEFFKDKSRKDGYSNKCKECESKRVRDKDKIRERDKKYRDENLETIKKRQKVYREKNIEKLQKINAEWRKNNHEYVLKKNREYYHDNKEILNKKALIRIKNRRKIDINYRMKLSLRSRLHEALKGNTKAISTIKLLGCSIPELRLYLETKFTEGMNWENYGSSGWVIDHIIPCNSFNLANHDEQKRCFHYTNLQPLWWKDNIIKADKI